MSKTPMLAYANTQFGEYSGTYYLKDFYWIRDRVLFAITCCKAYSALNRFTDFDTKMKAYLQIHGYNPDYIFTLILNCDNRQYFTTNTISDDLLMLKSIDKKMGKRELKKLHYWVLFQIGQLSQLCNKLKNEENRLMNIYEGMLLQVTHKQPAPMPIVNTQNIKNNLLRVVR